MGIHLMCRHALLSVAFLRIPLDGKYSVICRNTKRNPFYYVSSLRCISLYERTPRGTEYPPPPTEPLTIPQYLKKGFKLLKEESKLFIEEVNEWRYGDRKFYQHGDTERVFQFQSEESLTKWKLASDKDSNEGNSQCTLIVNNNNKAVFSGVVDTTIPKDGKVKRTGFCTMRSQKLRKSFYRPDHYFWLEFTHLEMRVRGDGRNYAVLLGIGNEFDLMWLDIYMYQLYTHGGPYWQTVRIPFSKFYLTSKGRIQDKQFNIPRNKIDSVGITCATVPGPFKLEIDYIGVHVDRTEKEKFAYEMYQLPQYLVS